MAEPGTTGEAIQIVRRVLYDLARQPSANQRGVTQAEILNYAIKRDWKVPVTDFERAIGRHVEVGTVVWDRPDASNPAQDRFRLTVRGDLEEENARRAWHLNVLDELRKPPRVVDLLYLLGGIAVSLVAQVILYALGVK